ncbi:MAG: 30S ribosomal protein S9 [Candidatus Calescibacterium sp.]|jgi:small subunit ribosomal protein S9
MIGVEKVNIKVPKNEVPQRGARKRAVAKVWIWEKKEANPNPEIYVNRIPYDKYFPDKILQIIVRRPLEVTNRVEKYIVFAQIRGSGPSAQAQAIAHGISRALEKKEPELRKILKPLGLLTRDPREVERKKYGRRKARKTQQWKKR